jgi:hypothetical protein
MMKSWQQAVISAPLIVSGIGLLLLDPPIDIDALKPPQTAHFEGGQLALLRHDVDCLRGDPEQSGHLRQR